MLIFLILLSVAFTVAYLFLLYFYASHINVPATLPNTHSPLPFCSVVIAARNEGKNIKACLESVTTQSYPAEQFEVLVVNDSSEDDTAEMINRFPSVRRLNTHEGMQGKKHALTLGIAGAKGEIIVTTDADCIVHPDWLETMAANFDDDIQMVTGPVLITEVYNAFERFQALDLAGLALITQSGIQSGLHHLANGANMAFRKQAFDAVGGFDGNTEFASGDDVFLVQKIARAFPKSIAYASEHMATVMTAPCHSLSAFIQQRLRWATKNKALKEQSVFWIWVLIWFALAINFINTIIFSLQASILLILPVLCIVAIAIAEYAFLKQATLRFQLQHMMKGFAMSFVFHYAYVLWAGVAGAVTRNYVWKDRRTR